VHKKSAFVIDDEDLGDSDYSKNNDSSDERNEDHSENENSSSNENDEENLSRKRRKKERKKRKKREKKKRKRKRKKERKMKEHRKDTKNNSASLDMSRTDRSDSAAKLDDDKPTMSDQSSAKRKIGFKLDKIKQIGQKFKKKIKEKESDSDSESPPPKLMKADDVSADDYKLRPNPLNIKGSAFKDMFKGKRHKKDGSSIQASYDDLGGTEKRLISPKRTERSQTFSVQNESEKKKKRFGGLRGFKRKNKDDNSVDYGFRKDRQKKRDSKRRRGSDSSLVGMSQDFDFSVEKIKKRKKIKE